MKKILYLIIALCALTLISCEEDKPVLTTGSLGNELDNNFTNLAHLNDTIYVTKHQNIATRYAPGDNIKVISINIYIDNNLVKSIHNNIIDLHISEYDYGMHSMSFEIITLPEGCNLEKRTFLTYKLRIVDDIDKYMISHNIVNGHFTLSWKDFKKDETQKYVVTKKIKSPHGNVTQKFETNIPTLIDKQYVGENASYYIVKVKRDGSKEIHNKYSTDSEKLNYTLETAPEGGYNLILEKCRYSNFGGYFIAENNQLPEVNQLNTDINDTIFHFADKNLGDKIKVYIGVLPKTFPSQTNTYIKWSWYARYLSFTIGEDMPINGNSNL